MHKPDTAAEIQSAMAAARSTLFHDMDQVVEGTQKLTDWRYYVRQHPLWCCAAAAAAGYFLVPARHKPAQTTSDNAPSSDRAEQAANVAGASLGGTVMRMVLMSLAKQAAAVAAERGGEWLNKTMAAARQNTQEVSEPIGDYDPGEVSP